MRHPRAPTKLRSALVVLGVLLSRPAAAYRPFDSTDAAVVEKGKCEIELGPVEYVRVGDERFLVLPKAVLNLGVARNWEVVLEGRHVRRISDNMGESRSSLEDTGLFVKGIVRDGGLQEKRGPSVAIEVGPLLPTIHGEAGAGFSLAAICSQRFPTLTVHVSGAALRTRAGNFGVSGGLIVEGSERHPLRPVAEILAEHESRVGSTVAGLVGVIYKASEALALDAAVRAARVEGLGSLEVRAGFTWAFTLGRMR